MLHMVSTSMVVAFDGRMHDGYWRDRAHPWFALAMLGLIVGAVILVTWLILSSRRPQHPPTPPAAHAAPVAPPTSPTAGAEAILAERLARGEISADDYRSLLAALREQPPVTPLA